MFTWDPTAREAHATCMGGQSTCGRRDCLRALCGYVFANTVRYMLHHNTHRIVRCLPENVSLLFQVNLSEVNSEAITLFRSKRTCAVLCPRMFWH